MPFDVRRCLVKHIDHPAQCAVPVGRAVDTTLAALEQSAVRLTPAATYVNLNARICDSVCSAMRDGVVRYMDTNHLTVRFATSLTAPLNQSLDLALAKSPDLAAAPHPPPR